MHRYLNTWMIDSRVGEVIIPCNFYDGRVVTIARVLLVAIIPRISTTADGPGRGGDRCDSAVRLRGSGDAEGSRLRRVIPPVSRAPLSAEAGGRDCAG